MPALALAAACSGSLPLAVDAITDDNPISVETDPDPYLSLCEGMLQHVVRERPGPAIHLLMGWRAGVLTAEHTGGDQGSRHIVTLVYDATTDPGTEEMPIRDRMICEYPSDPDWWRGRKRQPEVSACLSMAVYLLPDRISADGKEIRYDDRPQGRAKIEDWADQVKVGLCARGRSSLWPRRADWWTAADAYRNCLPMLDALGTPESAPPGCNALHMCANEAQLDDAEMAKLYELIKETPGCEPP